MTQESKTKRYNLALPEEVFSKITEIADSEGCTMVDVIKRFVKLGFVIYELEKRGGEFVIRDDTSEKRLIVFKNESE